MWKPKRFYWSFLGPVWCVVSKSVLPYIIYSLITFKVLPIIIIMTIWHTVTVCVNRNPTLLLVVIKINLVCSHPKVFIGLVVTIIPRLMLMS